MGRGIEGYVPSGIPDGFEDARPDTEEAQQLDKFCWS